jgi:hypothetical protein
MKLQLLVPLLSAAACVLTPPPSETDRYLANRARNAADGVTNSAEEMKGALSAMRKQNEELEELAGKMRAADAKVADDLAECRPGMKP